MKESVAVVGAGMSGLVAARALAESGYGVQLFDKARGPGGRMATRRGEDGLFDHGAQYFTARDPRFCARVDAWLQEGVVQAWDGRFGAAAAGEARIGHEIGVSAEVFAVVLNPIIAAVRVHVPTLHAIFQIEIGRAHV